MQKSDPTAGGNGDSRASFFYWFGTLVAAMSSKAFSSNRLCVFFRGRSVCVLIFREYQLDLTTEENGLMRQMHSNIVGSEIVGVMIVSDFGRSPARSDP